MLKRYAFGTGRSVQGTPLHTGAPRNLREARDKLFDGRSNKGENVVGRGIAVVVHLRKCGADALRVCFPNLHILHVDAADVSLAKRKAPWNLQRIVSLSQKRARRLFEWA